MPINMIRDTRVDAGFKRFTERRNALIQAAHEGLYEGLEQIAVNCDDYGRDICESPIEELFLIASALRGFKDRLVGSPGGGSYRFTIVPKRMDIKQHTSCQIPESEIAAGVRCYDILFPQPTVLTHRVDFAWTRSYHDGSHGPFIPMAAVLIECDGHDFHERTKEQAARDRQRDRELQAAGYVVLRFTGSELWRDAAVCVDAVHDTFEQVAFRFFQFQRISDSQK